MKAKKTFGGPEETKNEEKIKSENEAGTSEKSEPVKRPAVSKNTVSVLFAIGVYVVGTVLLAYLRALKNPDATITDIVLSNNFWLFTVTCGLSWIYGWLKNRSMLHIVNRVLMIEITILVIILLLPVVFVKKPATAESYAANRSTSYAALAKNATYDDSDTSYKEPGTYWFPLSDSGQTTEEIGHKKDVRNWHIDLSRCKSFKFLIIFDDGYVIKMWESGSHDLAGGRKMKIQALEPNIGKVGIIFDPA